MNIKSLLLGSAAALAVVSGAQAADAIVAAEPEPMEYVRVCDAFGTGYFYIPGTETCLKVGGRVRYDMQLADSYTPNSDDGWNKQSRAELYLDSASDTEFGALKTNIVARWDWRTNGFASSGDNTRARLIAANITLGGFLVGLADSQFNAFIGYAGDVINDDVIGDGPYEVNQIAYTYDAGNGFSATIAAEDSGRRESDNKYMPDLVAGVGYAGGAWAFKVVGGYDAVAEEGAIKARVDATLGSVNAWVMAGWNTDGDTINKYANGDSVGNSWGDWAVWGGFGTALTDNLGANLQLAYTDNKTFAAAANLKWTVVPGLLIQPEVTYTNWDTIDEDQWNGMVRFQRTF